MREVFVPIVTSKSIGSVGHWLKNLKSWALRPTCDIFKQKHFYWCFYYYRHHYYFMVLEIEPKAWKNMLSKLHSST